MDGAAAQQIELAEHALTARDLPRALSHFNAAEAAGSDPNHCGGGRWLASMLAGDFESAWREGDAIRARGADDPHRFWQGEDVRGKRVIVRSLHGFGDAVQMLRFAPRLRELAASVVYEVPPRFVDLARCFAGVDEVVTWSEHALAQQPQWDVQVEVMELPYLLRLQPSDLPGATNYLHLPAPELARVAERMGEWRRPRFGVVWTCGGWNPSRAIPPTLLESLIHHAAWDAVEFWSLESETPPEALTRLRMRDAAQVCGRGMLALAATIAQLDAVITVDTLAAHLAGALGKPALVLLQHAADWRWMHARRDTPWYPTLRLFRQPAAGDWAGTVAALLTSEEVAGA